MQLKKILRLSILPLIGLAVAASAYFIFVRNPSPPPAPSNQAASTNAAPTTAPAPPASETVNQYGVWELTRIYDSSKLANPWEQASLAAVLTSPSGKKSSIDGFYYDINTWKIRFAPDETGTWQWSLNFTAQNGNAPIAETGAFLVTVSANPGFLRISQANPFRFVFDNGALFNGIGFGECMNDSDNNGDPYDQMGIDGGFRAAGQENSPDVKFPGLDGYFSTYGAPGAGFNLYRWSVDNCAYKLWNTISPAGNAYLVKEGKWGDDLVQNLQKNGLRVWMAIFGFEPPFPESGADNPQEQEAIKRYIRYITARYGAYVDVWELMNEATVREGWYAFAEKYLRSIDPYGHPITTSWEKPELAYIDINAPHWYELESEFESDKAAADRINFSKRHWKKPIVFGEQGNSVQNWDPKSALRFRIRSWSAFFNEGMLIFWNTSSSKDYKTPVAANVYIGPEERGYVKILQNFTAGVDPAAQIDTISVAPEASTRAYALSSPKSFLAYITNVKNHTDPTGGLTVNFKSPISGTAVWINPKTGATLGTASVTQGQQTLQIPPFVTDIALKVAP